MVKIRMARHGAKKRPYYHIVVANSESPRDGRFLEQLGVYDPSREDELRLDLERVDYWVSVGARPSSRVKKLINIMRNRPDEPIAAPEPKAEAEAPKPKAEAEAPKAEAEEAPAEPAAEPAAEEAAAEGSEES